MLTFRRSWLFRILLSCAATAPVSCHSAQVSGPGGAGGSDVPGAMAGGVNLRDAGAAPGQDASMGSAVGAGGAAGAAGGPVVGPMDPGGPACAMEVRQADRLPVDLLLLVDSSSSMETKVPGSDRTKGALINEALTSFVKDPASAGLGVGLRFFPGGVSSGLTPGGAGGPFCQPSTYEKPTVPIAELPGAEGSVVRALQTVTYSSGTPLGPALSGGLALARAHQAANPTHRVALVLAGDGFPSGCQPSEASGISALVAAATTATPPISTYAIGVFGGADIMRGGPILESVATAGGTGKPLVLNTDPNLAQTFLDALKKIRQAALPCEFLIPRPNGPIDFGKVNVRLQPSAGGAEEIHYVATAGRCDPMRGGWHYDVDPATATPTRVVTCPATCERFNTGPAVSVSLVFGCKTVVIE